jgi:hypothetical protein
MRAQVEAQRSGAGFAIRGEGWLLFGGRKTLLRFVKPIEVDNKKKMGEIIEKGGRERERGEGGEKKNTSHFMSV